MPVRGRGSSSAPQDLVGAVADRADVEIPGDDDERDNRLAGLGPLLGTGVGVVVGAMAGLVIGALRKRGITPSAPVPVLLIGAAAMALADVPLKLFGISEPSEWEVSTSCPSMEILARSPTVDPRVSYPEISSTSLRSPRKDNCLPRTSRPPRPC